MSHQDCSRTRHDHARTAVLSVALLACVACTKPVDGDTTSETTGSTGGSETANDDGTGNTTNSSSTTQTSDGDTQTSDGDTGSTAGMADGGLIGDPDIPGDLTCDVWAQDCVEDQKCQPVDTNLDGFTDADYCVPLDANPREVGESCAWAEGGRVDNCRKGAECMTVGNTTGDAIEGTCVALCTGSPSDPICENNQNCTIWNRGAEPWCTEPCDLLVQDCQATGWMCAFASLAAGGGCVPDKSGPDGARGDPCAYEPGPCDPGLTCITAGLVAGCSTNNTGCCTTYCDINAPNTCDGADSGEECIAAEEFVGLTPGLEHLGICVLPP